MSNLVVFLIVVYKIVVVAIVVINHLKLANNLIELICLIYIYINTLIYIHNFGTVCLFVFI